MDRFQDALLTEELDPGLFRKSGPVPETERSADGAVCGIVTAGDWIGKSADYREESVKAGATVEQILASYDDKAPLEEASTIPAPWYVDARIAELERQTVFSRTWQVMGRADQVEKPGQICDRDSGGRATGGRARE